MTAKYRFFSQDQISNRLVKLRACFVDSRIEPEFFLDSRVSFGHWSAEQVIQDIRLLEGVQSGFRPDDRHLLCNEVLHTDLLHFSTLDNLSDRLTGVEYFAVRSVMYLLFGDIQKRIDRLGGMAGEW